METSSSLKEYVKEPQVVTQATTGRQIATHCYKSMTWDSLSQPWHLRFVWVALGIFFTLISSICGTRTLSKSVLVQPGFVAMALEFMIRSM